jgi:dUTP pyrophosphatase
MNEKYELPDFKKLLLDDNFDSMYEKITNQLGVDLKMLEEDLEKSNDGKIKIDYVTTTGKMLHYNYLSDSGFDLSSTEDIEIAPFGRALVPTGVHFKLPEDYEIQVRPKSGLAINHGITVLNTPGTIDEGYTGEVKVIIFNTNPEKFTINKGMKVAQCVVSRCITGRWVTLNRVEDINDGERGDNGFGSTGI